jgi:hypothetical protein
MKEFGEALTRKPQPLRKRLRHKLPSIGVRFQVSSEEVGLESLLTDIWIAANPEHLLMYHCDEAEVAANARRRRALRRANIADPSLDL